MKHRVIYFVLFAILIIGCLIACICNIVYSVKFTESQYTNVFTALGGWVSGISTIVLGIIAVWQNKQYKRQSDKDRLLNDLKKEVDLVDDIYFRYIESCDSSIMILNAQKLNRQDKYLDKIIEFQIFLSKFVALIFNKITTMKFYINNNLYDALQKYFDTVDLKIIKITKVGCISSADLEKISESFDKTREEFIAYNAQIGEFYNKCLKKTPEEIQCEIDSMILNRNKRFKYKEPKEVNEKNARSNSIGG